ncbi:MAG: polysaccharide biosynthesis C-terminal domain-containing protein [Candidatus Micrarchaeota archaeon]
MAQEIEARPQGDLFPSPLKTIFRSAGLFFAGMVFGKAAFYFFRLLVARIGSSEYGTLSIALGFIDIIYAVSLLGLGIALQKLISEKRSLGKNREVGDLLFTSFRAVFVVSLSFAVCLFVAADWIAVSIFHTAVLSDVLRILAIGVPFYAMQGVLFGTFRAFGKIQYEILTKQFVETGLKLGFALAFIYAGWSLAGITIGYVLAIIIAFIVALFFLETKIRRFFTSGERYRGIEGEILPFSIPLMFSGLINFFLAWTDVFFIGYFWGASQAGIYSTALPTAALLIMAPMSLNLLFLPIVSSLLTLNKTDEFRKIYSVLTKWAFGVNLALFMLFAFFGRQVLRVLFGQAYEDGELPLQILSFGYLAYSLFFNSSDVLSALGKTGQILTNITLAAALNISLNYLLVPVYGISGAAIATSLSLVLYGGLNAYGVFRLTGALPVSRAFIWMIVSGGASMFASFAAFRALSIPSSDTSLLVFGMLYGLLYAVCLVLFRIPDRTDFEVLVSIERKAGLNFAFIKRPLKKYYGL